MSSAIPVRDPVATAQTLARWLSEQLGGDAVEVSDLTIPKAGFSNETILGRADWNDAQAAHHVDFVLRIEPTAHQLFAQPDALRQAQVMQALTGLVPVPQVWLSCGDRSVLGAPFFLMKRVFGRIPSDVPSWHKRGWTTEIDPESRTLLHDNALTQLVHLHAVETSEMQFLWPAGSGTALTRYISQLHESYKWCGPVLRHGRVVIDAAMGYVLAEQPDHTEAKVVWGDARVGNIIFGDDLSVAALLDWEGATVGPPEIDVAWWVMFDEFLCEAHGLRRLEGVADRAGTLCKYEQLSGKSLRSMQYYSVAAGLLLALINSRLADLLVSSGTSSDAFAAEIVTRVTTMVARTLDGSTVG